MPIDDLTALGDALRAARKEKNLTQEQLADESHVSTKQIADIEKARRNPSYLILKICRTLRKNFTLASKISTYFFITAMHPIMSTYNNYTHSLPSFLLTLRLMICFNFMSDSIIKKQINKATTSCTFIC